MKVDGHVVPVQLNVGASKDKAPEGEDGEDGGRPVNGTNEPGRIRIAFGGAGGEGGDAAGDGGEPGDGGEGGNAGYHAGDGSLVILEGGPGGDGGGGGPSDGGVGGWARPIERDHYPKGAQVKCIGGARGKSFGFGPSTDEGASAVAVVMSGEAFAWAGDGGSGRVGGRGGRGGRALAWTLHGADSLAIAVGGAGGDGGPGDASERWRQGRAGSGGDGGNAMTVGPGVLAAVGGPGGSPGAPHGMPGATKPGGARAGRQGRAIEVSTAERGPKARSSRMTPPHARGPVDPDSGCAGEDAPSEDRPHDGASER